MVDGFQQPSGPSDPLKNDATASQFAPTEDVIYRPDGSIEQPARRFGPFGIFLAATIWILIMGFVVFTLATPYDPSEHVEPGSDQPLTFADQTSGMLEVTRFRFESDPEVRKEIIEQARSQEKIVPATYMVRLSRSIVSLENEGPAAALESLKNLDELAAEKNYTPNEFEARRRATLERLYRDVEAGSFDLPSVSEEDRSDLRQSFGWHGALALEPPGGPSVTATREALIHRAIILIVGMSLFLFAGILLLGSSLFVSITSLVLCITRRGWFKPTVIIGRGTIYLETFALWMIWFFGAMSLLPLIVPESLLTLVSLLGSLSSLLVLFWPVIRGVPWSEVKKDVGFQCDSIFRECIAGIWGYLTALPVMAMLSIGWFIIVAFITWANQASNPNSLFESPSGPGHPIQEMVAGGNVWPLVSVAVLAVILAPLIEETFFRGVLYRHLRELSSKRARWISAILGGVVSGFIFAAIHPQGILLVPPLGMLGFVFAMIREWRGSLFASMTAHALHNGMLISILVFLVLTTTL